MVSRLSEQPRNANLLLTELVDAVRYSQNYERLLKEQTELKTHADKQLQMLDDVAPRISLAFDGLDLDPKEAEGLARKINEFAALAVQQTRDRIKSRLQSELDDSAARLKSEDSKAKKSLESFLAAQPLSVIDEEFSLELANGSYTTLAEYKCAGEIEYEFLLNAAGSPMFRSELTFARVQKGVKLPARLGKAWLKREPVPDFERLDGYGMIKARASKNHLTAVFQNHETSSVVTLVYSRSADESFLTIEYADEKGKVDVTAEAGLSKYLDLPPMKTSTGRILDAIVDLKKEKLQLNKLDSEGKDILATLDCLGFMQHVAVVISQSKESMEALRTIDPKMAIERLKLLGPGAAKMMEILGFVPRSTKLK
jgi:hypothetical protein